MEIRKKQISVYTNDEENKKIKDGAEKVGLSFCSFIRMSAIEKSNKILQEDSQ